MCIFPLAWKNFVAGFPSAASRTTCRIRSRNLIDEFSKQQHSAFCLSIRNIYIQKRKCIPLLPDLLDSCNTGAEILHPPIGIHAWLVLISNSRSVLLPITVLITSPSQRKKESLSAHMLHTVLESQEIFIAVTCILFSSIGCIVKLILVAT